MKFIIRTYILLIFCIVLVRPSAFSQSAFHFSADAEVNADDSVVLRLKDYVGDIQWQKSYDIEKWDNIDGATADTLLFEADTTTYFRAEVIVGDCDPFYSDTIYISVYRTTKEAILVGRYDLTLVSDSTQIAAGLYEYEGDVDEIEIGSILVSNQGYGYMRKVTGIHSVKSSSTIFETEQAVLTDVVEEMNLFDSLLITLSDAPTKKAYVNGRPVPVQTLYLIPGARLKSAKSGVDLSGVNFNIEAKQGDLTGTISATITDGHILFEPVFYRELDIRWVPPRVNNFKLAAGGVIEFHCDVTVESNIDINLVEDTLRIVYLVIGPIPLGPVPMFIEYSIEKSFTAGFSVSGEIFFGFESNLGAKFGASYNRDHEPQWNSILEAGGSFNQKPFDFNLSASAYAQFGIGPRFDAKIAGVAGPYLSVTPYLRGDLTASWPSDWSFGLSAGIGSKLGFEVGILNRSLINYYTTLPGPSWSIFETGGEYEYEEPVVETLPVVDITSTSATSGGNILVEGSSSVTARGVVWSTEENPTLENNDGFTEDGTGTGEFTSKMTGLSPDTNYYARAYATNSAGKAYGTQIEFTTIAYDQVDWPRDTETQVVEVTNPATGRVWMDRNLGASRAATSSYDEEAYGHLYQWGRAADGHQIRTSPTTSTLSNSDTPGHGEFILSNSDAKWDWRSPQNHYLWEGINGINNPCPAGYRLPTEAEFDAERQSWSSNNSDGAFASPLKLPLAGYRSRSDGSLSNVGSYGYYWSGTWFSVLSQILYFHSTNADMFIIDRAFGFSVRCLKE